MLWPSGKLDVIFRNIKKNSSQTTCSVLILSAVDPDAVCATRTLTDLFKLESISYKQEPVVGYDDMLKKYNDCVNKSGNSIKSIVTINCGGAVNLSKFFNLKPGISFPIQFCRERDTILNQTTKKLLKNSRLNGWTKNLYTSLMFHTTRSRSFFKMWFLTIH